MATTKIIATVFAVGQTNTDNKEENTMCIIALVTPFGAVIEAHKSDDPEVSGIEDGTYVMDGFTFVVGHCTESEYNEIKSGAKQIDPTDLAIGLLGMK